jgi:hypothetical protein
VAAADDADRGRGRPPLPEEDVLSVRRSVRLTERDAADLAALRALLGTDDAGVLRIALRDYARRRRLR